MKRRPKEVVRFEFAASLCKELDIHPDHWEPPGYPESLSGPFTHVADAISGAAETTPQLAHDFLDAYLLTSDGDSLGSIGRVVCAAALLELFGLAPSMQRDVPNILRALTVLLESIDSLPSRAAGISREMIHWLSGQPAVRLNEVERAQVRLGEAVLAHRAGLTRHVPQTVIDDLRAIDDTAADRLEPLVRRSCRVAD
jgi:hypothetical protein